MTADRVLPLSGVHNFRDYGGYAIDGGGRLRSDILWRSAHHQDATADDLAAVDRLGIETIIDLRGDDERAEHPCKRSGNFSARVLFAEGNTAGLAPHLQAAGGAIDAETARARMIDVYAAMPYRPVLVNTLPTPVKPSSVCTATSVCTQSSGFSSLLQPPSGVAPRRPAHRTERILIDRQGL